MGTVHKFQRPPKNENQFKGYRPPGMAQPKPAGGRWRKLWARHRALIAWALLIAVAAALVGVRALLGTIR